MSLLDKLTKFPDWQHDDEVMYEKVDIMKVYGEINLLSDKSECILAIKKDDIFLDWGLFQWYCGDDSGDYYKVIWHGHGIFDSLREGRHSYFGMPGENGYVFYAPFSAIEQTAKILQQYFD